MTLHADETWLRFPRTKRHLIWQPSEWLFDLEDARYVLWPLVRWVSDQRFEPTEESREALRGDGYRLTMTSPVGTYVEVRERDLTEGNVKEGFPNEYWATLTLQPLDPHDLSALLSRVPRLDGSRHPPQIALHSHAMDNAINIRIRAVTRPVFDAWLHQATVLWSAPTSVRGAYAPGSD